MDSHGYVNPCRCQLCETPGGIYLPVTIEDSVKKTKNLEICLIAIIWRHMAASLWDKCTRQIIHLTNIVEASYHVVLYLVSGPCYPSFSYAHFNKLNLSEVFSNAVIAAERLRIFPPLSLTKYLFIKVSELRQWGENEIARQ